MSAEGLTKSIWMHLLREGGRWTQAELRYAMPGSSLHSIEMALGRMAAGGSLMKFRDDTRKNGVSYGVTSGCKVPHNVTLAELTATGIVKGAV